MAATAAYATTIKVSGTSTAFTTEACTLVSGKTYQITDTAKRIWDPNTDIRVFDNSVEVTDDANIESYDMLFGKVTFASGYTPTTPITITGAYMPMHAVSQPKEFSLNISHNLLNGNYFRASGTDQIRLAGLRDCSGSIGRIEDGLVDIDTGGGTLRMWDILTNKVPVVLEIVFGGSASNDMTFRGWIMLENDEIGGDVDALIESTLAFQDAAKHSTIKRLQDASLSIGP